MRRGRRTVPRRAAALAVVLSLGLAAPSRSADARQPPPRPTPLTLAAAAHVERANLSEALQSAPEPAAVVEGGKPFFKTRSQVEFGAPDSVVAPRQVTFGARWSF